MLEPKSRKLEVAAYRQNPKEGNTYAGFQF